jgi:hypothetical protein
VQQIGCRRNGATGQDFMVTIPKPRLRNALRKLRTVEPRLAAGYSRGELGQEMLDFLAMAAGLKPVYLLGRGFDDPAWIAGVLKIARDMGLRAVEGPYWDADPPREGFPGWYADHAAAALAGRRAHYVCRVPPVAQMAARICGTGRPTIAEEALLLGYPECCVAAHYQRVRAFHVATMSILDRTAGGDEAAMRRLLEDETQLAPQTETERIALEGAMMVAACPWTSVNMCDDCAGRPDSPAARLSAQYAALAREIDGDLAFQVTTPPEMG